MTRFCRLLVIASVSLGALAAPAVAHGASDTGGGYVVQPGDYLIGIAHQGGVTLGDLLRANRLAVTSVIHPGQRLAIPGRAATPPPAGGRTYTVRSGDYLFGIARRLGVSTSSLLSANGLTLTSVIHPGQRLTVPAAANPPAPTTRPPARPTASPAPPRAGVVERIIRDVWPAALAERALAIAWRESRFQPDAQGRCCSGLFQLYYDVHRGWLAGLDIDSRRELYNPRTNAEAAFALYRRAGGWQPWSL